jgi:hypothetical protein
MEIDLVIDREYDQAAMNRRISAIEVKYTQRYGVSSSRQIRPKVCRSIVQGRIYSSPPTRGGWSTLQGTVVYDALSVICADDSTVEVARSRQSKSVRSAYGHQ